MQIHFLTLTQKYQKAHFRYKKRDRLFFNNRSRYTNRPGASDYRSIILIDSIPTLPPRTTSIVLNSSFINFTTASFFVAV